MSSISRSNLRIVPGGKPAGEAVIAIRPQAEKQSPETREIATPRGVTPFGLAMTPEARIIVNQGKPSNQSPIAQYLSERSPLSSEGLSPEEAATAQRRDAILQMFLSFGSALNGEDPKWVKNPKA